MPIPAGSNVSPVKGIALLSALLIAAVTYAVDSFDYHCANIALLQDRGDGLGKVIQKEIGITEAQRKKMNDVASAYRAKLEAYQKQLKGSRPDLNVLNQRMAELKRGIVGLMTPAQIKRLRELNLQAAGLIGLLDKVVATKIGMTDAQYKQFYKTYVDGKTSAESIVKATMVPIDQKYQKLALAYKGQEKQHEADLKKLHDQYMGEANAAERQIQPRIKAITDGTQQKMTAMITAKQKAAWIALQGKRFVPPSK